ncbi:hypothetical protein D9758_013083 [Tetrapyrgos nigripes]|uniref:Uncharacterized protein n=1 Tax=Tetrapyrgos nigripes TaxID=182062 RepID=A0A8H5C9V5_9AGAR|nr:hypothetical protein D9758_013083 [Tetrapyrgos nigripes]
MPPSTTTTESTIFIALLKRVVFNYANLEIAANGHLRLVKFLEQSPIGPVYSAFDHDAEKWYAISCIIKFDDGSMDASLLDGLEVLSKFSNPNIVRPWSVYKEIFDGVEFDFLVMDYLTDYLACPSTRNILMLYGNGSRSQTVRMPVSTRSSGAVAGKKGGPKSGRKEGKARTLWARVRRSF